MSKTIKSLIFVVSVSALTACVSQEHLSDEFGSALRGNQQAQISNPDAAMGEAKEVMLDGQKAEQVISGYRKEKKDADTGRLIQGVAQ